MDLSNHYKKRLENNLLITCNDEKISTNIDLFIRSFLRYKSTGIKYLKTNKSSSLCPLVKLYKCVYYYFNHSFSFHPKFVSNFEKAKLETNKLLIQHNIEIEEYEKMFIELFETIINYRKKDTFLIFLNISKKFPNDLLNLRFALELSLLSGKKTFTLKLAENHSKFEDNYKNVFFVGNKSFILLESKDYKEGSRLLKLGVSLDDKDMWIQHNFSHLFYYINQAKETIDYLENCRKMWKIRDNFIYKHNIWHLAIGYLDCGDFEKGDEIEEMLINFNINEAECLVNILGYIMRMFFRGNFNFIRRRWLIKLYNFIMEEKRLMYNYLYDCMAIWTISFLFNFQKNINYFQINNFITIDKNVLNDHYSLINESLQKDTYQNFFDKVKSNVNKVNSKKDRDFIENEYTEFLNAMIKLGNCDFKESLDIFRKNHKKIKKIGGSVEQRLVIAETIIFNAINISEYDYAEKIIKEYFSMDFDSIFIKKCVKKIKFINKN